MHEIAPADRRSNVGEYAGRADGDHEGPKMTNDPIPKENQNVTTLSNQPALDAELEAELAQIRRAPTAAVAWERRRIRRTSWSKAKT